MYFKDQQKISTQQKKNTGQVILEQIQQFIVGQRQTFRLSFAGYSFGQLSPKSLIMPNE